MIKKIFRAWNIERKQMYKVGSLVFRDNWIGANALKDNKISDTIGMNCYDRSQTEFILMQFTGRYDCNKKPIYEGDIIEFDRNEWGGDDNIHIVEWDNENSEWCFGGGSASDMEWRTVIGNIHENSELLNRS